MVDNSEEIGLPKVAIVYPSTAEQNELIAQLMQQIAEFWVEIQKMQDLPNPGMTANIPGDRRPLLYFPPLNSSAEHFITPPSNPIQNPSTIDLPTPIPITPSPHIKHRLILKIPTLKPSLSLKTRMQTMLRLFPILKTKIQTFKHSQDILGSS
uniref:Uncharacterized protein n=1 Tax=Solanum tuberosum TaxID=4113 RepID=M1DY26_SOLTU